MCLCSRTRPWFKCKFFLDLCQFSWFYLPISIKILSVAVTCVCVFVCLCVCVWDRKFVPLWVYALGPDLHLNVIFFRFMPVLFILFANFCKNALCCSHIHLCVCVCVCVCVWDRKFVLLFIYALGPDLGLYVEIFRFIMDLLLFFWQTKFKKVIFFIFPFIFNVGSFWPQTP